MAKYLKPAVCRTAPRLTLPPPNKACFWDNRRLQLAHAENIPLHAPAQACLPKLRVSLHSLVFYRASASRLGRTFVRPPALDSCSSGGSDDALVPRQPGRLPIRTVLDRQCSAKLQIGSHVCVHQNSHQTQ